LAFMVRLVSGYLPAGGISGLADIHSSSARGARFVVNMGSAAEKRPSEQGRGPSDRPYKDERVSIASSIALSAPEKLTCSWVHRFTAIGFTCLGGCEGQSASNRGGPAVVPSCGATGVGRIGRQASRRQSASPRAGPGVLSATA